MRSSIHAYEGVLSVATTKGKVFTQGRPAVPTGTAGSCAGQVCVNPRHWEEVF